MRPRDVRHRHHDILYTSPAKLFADLRTLIAALPDQTVLLDLPLPAGCWGSCRARALVMSADR